MAQTVLYSQLTPAVQRLLQRNKTDAANFDRYIADIERSTAERERQGENDHLIFYVLQSKEFTKTARLEPAVCAKQYVESGTISKQTQTRMAQFDWIGWMLMMSTLWSWVYRRLGPRVQTRYLRAKRHARALVKLVQTRYGENFEKFPPAQRWWARQRYLGIEDDAPFFEALWIRFGYWRTMWQRSQVGDVTAEEYDQLVKHYSDLETNVPIIVGVVAAVVKTGLQGVVLRTLDVLTRSVFSGLLGVCLFAAGFLLWNVSKIATLIRLAGSSGH